MPPDLLALTADLIAIPSLSLKETSIADFVEARLTERAPSLECIRVGDNVIARTNSGHERRLLVGGHLDTVPADQNENPRIEGDSLFGLGAADMKGGLAVMLTLAEAAHALSARLRLDLTVVFYVAEEITEEHNGLRVLFAEHPDLVAADLAILMEPTGAWVEAGCQGSLTVEATFTGVRAHSARPWMGDNAIHSASKALANIAAHNSDSVTVDGLEYRESIQVVHFEGGVANNVVPDSARMRINRRFAPAYDTETALAQVSALLEGATSLVVINESPAAPPNLMNPLIAEFIGTNDLAVRPKLGWTDVARFTSHGIPALNFGPGNPEIAHTRAEFVDRIELDACYAVLARFIGII
ncbi:MAG: succinyl-diaminopimelate desuccinylase [Acidimicrobiia bacterium]|nr:succinyl-diaminopimelate desuccinylase [Acidimicrobiia bacterium]